MLAEQLVEKEDGSESFQCHARESTDNPKVGPKAGGTSGKWVVSCVLW